MQKREDGNKQRPEKRMLQEIGNFQKQWEEISRTPRRLEAEDGAVEKRKNLVVLGRYYSENVKSR